MHCYGDQKSDGIVSDFAQIDLEAPIAVMRLKYIDKDSQVHIFSPL